MDVIPVVTQLAESTAGEKIVVPIAVAIELETQALETFLEEGLKLEAKRFGELFKTENTKEGVHTFIEKRQARFKDS